VARIIAQAATGLHAAHELCNPDGLPLGVVHRDVSPQNLLVSYDGHVKVVDFGIAYAAERLVHTRTGTLKGKVAYMSPEQVAQRPLDRRSDLYSLGIVFYEMICMRRLFRRDTDIETLQAVANPQIPRPGHVRPGIPTRLEAIILRALATDPEDRYATGEELAEDLEALLVSEHAVVTTRHLSQLMHQVFYEKKKSKDQQIKMALESRNPEPLQGIGMDTSSSAIDVPAALSNLVELPLPRSRKLTLIAGATLALLLALISGFLISRRVGQDRPAARPPAAHPGAGIDSQTPPPVVSRLSPDAGAPRVTIQVKILPDQARAEVVFRGRTYPGNLFRETVDQSSEPLTLELRAPGFMRRTEEVRPTASTELTFTLVPEAATPRPDRPGPRRVGPRPDRPGPRRVGPRTGMSGGLREPMW
jgi:serine/threonine protein kinase